MNNAKKHSINTWLKLKFRNNEAITTVHLAVSLLLLLLTESVLGLAIPHVCLLLMLLLILSHGTLPVSVPSIMSLTHLAVMSLTVPNLPSYLPLRA